MNPIWTLAQAVATSISGGANFVVFCETDLPASPKQTVIGFIKHAIRGRTPVVIMNDSTAGAIAGANGVHFEGDLPHILGPRCNVDDGQLVGVTVSTLEDVQSAVHAGADYLLAYFDWTMPDKSLLAVKKFVTASSLPLVVGVDVPLELVPEVMQAGAAGVGITYASCGAYDKTAETVAYWNLLNTK